MLRLKLIFPVCEIVAEVHFFFPYEYSIIPETFAENTFPFPI